MKKLILGLLVNFGFTTMLLAQIPTNGLIAWWPFSGDANDMSGNVLNGSVSGALLTTDRFNSPASAYDFDGINDYILVPDNDKLELTKDFSISLWFYSRTAGSFNSFLSKASCAEANKKGYVTGLNGYVSSPKVHIQAYPYMSNATPCIPNNNGIPQMNTWYHFITSYDNTAHLVRYYLNNIQFDSLSLNFDIDTTTLNFYIGHLFNQGGGGCINASFDGKLDDIRIYTRVLTKSEVLALHNEGTPTGLHSLTLQNAIKIYPNPAHSYVTIDNGANYTALNGYSIKIVNPLGQVMFHSSIHQQQFYMDVATWTGSGMYFGYIMDRTGNIIDVRKIVLQ